MGPETNTLPGLSKGEKAIRRVLNNMRNWYMLTIKYPHVRWGGRNTIVRIPTNTYIWSPHNDVTIGDRVQFGQNCLVQCDIEFGNSILMANDVAFVGKDVHITKKTGTPIWDSGRGDSFYYRGR